MPMPAMNVSPVTAHDSWARYATVGGVLSAVIWFMNGLSNESSGASNVKARTEGADRRVFPVVRSRYLDPVAVAVHRE